jgi:hypothetical protein
MCIHCRHQEAEETIKQRNSQIAELQKHVKEEKDKLKAQRTLYEQVRSDRNLFSKQQVQSEDEIAEMKRKFKIMAHQIDQLKEEIQSKDNALINEHFLYLKLQDQLKVQKRKLSKRKDSMETAHQVMSHQVRMCDLFHGVVRLDGAIGFVGGHALLP